jgi:hypothetical protein
MNGKNCVLLIIWTGEESLSLTSVNFILKLYQLFFKITADFVVLEGG